MPATNRSGPMASVIVFERRRWALVGALSPKGSWPRINQRTSLIRGWALPLPAEQAGARVGPERARSYKTENSSGENVVGTVAGRRTTAAEIAHLENRFPHQRGRSPM